MKILYGPRLYYSLFGLSGLLLGAKARVLRTPIEVAVAVPGVAHPLRLRLRTTDVALCREVLLNSQYDWEFHKSPRTIVDAGANIGLAAVFYANRYPEARIIAVEPELSNYEMLRENIAPYRNVTSVQAALWTENQQVNLCDPGTGHTRFQTRQNGENGRPVRGITMNKLMADFQIDYIDLLKVDIEGAEKELFERSGIWINSVGIIAVELHDWFRSGCSQAVHLAARDFKVEWQKGEITYLARAEYAPNAASQLQSATSSPKARPGNVTSRFPLKILRTS